MFNVFMSFTRFARFTHFMYFVCLTKDWSAKYHVREKRLRRYIRAPMRPLLGIILVLILVVIAIAGYEYYIHRPPSGPAVSPTSVTWELS